jgi:putative ABC transport system permease protein
MAAIAEYFHEIKKEKLRMFLTMLGLCWGMANIVVMLSVGEGLYRQFFKQFRTLGEGFVIVWSRQTSKPYAGFGIGRRVRLSEDDIPIIKNRVEEISLISPEYSRGNNNLKLGKSKITVRTIGVYPCYGEMRFFFPEPGGRFINRLDQERKRRVIFIGNGVRDDMFGKEVNPVGRTVLLNDIPFTVIGVLRKKLGWGSEEGEDADMTVIPASTFKVMFTRPYLDDIFFTPRSPEESKAAIKEFRRAMAAKYRFDPEDEQVFSTFDSIETMGIISKVFRGIQIFLGVVGGLTLIIAGIGVANIMYVTVRERTREIGIKMAVGARPGYIIGQFVIEALLTAVVGGALGIGLGLSMIEGFKALPIEHEVMNVIGKPVFSAMLALICSTILTFIGLLSGVFPANRASKVDPVEALRYE